VEVPDEVADLLREYVLLEEAYRIRTYRHRAFYSLDVEGKIERDLTFAQPSPFEIMERQRMKELVYKGLATLPEKQRQRIYAHFYLGMSQAAIAKAEGCDKSSVRDSIHRGLQRLNKFFEKNPL
ncbi:MAG: sigma-70 family RNA polymerase sigma factor, partial [Acutalibacter sp.]|nr:sigma-70 family RNA polymerase sigma factor [Acutalibacter sp.]